MSYYGFQTITADVYVPEQGWTTVTGFHVPFLEPGNPNRGVLTIYSGDEPVDHGPHETPVTQHVLASACERWTFGPGYWRAAQFGPVR